MSAPSFAQSARQLLGAILLIVAIGLPSCTAFNQTHSSTPVEVAD